MTATATAFDIEGRRFEVRRLDVDSTCRGLELLGKILGPAALEVFSARVGAAKPNDVGAQATLGGVNYGALLTAMVANASLIAPLLKLFTARAKFDRGKNGALVDLDPFVDEVFEGRLDVIVAFLFHAARAEYGGFLGGGGALAELLPQAASASGSPTAPKG